MRHSKGFAVGVIALSMMPVSVSANEIIEKLDYISKFASDNCVAVKTSGNATSTEIKGGVTAGLGGLFRKFTDVGGNGSVDSKISTYDGLVQEQLPLALTHLDECKAKVRDVLLGFLFPKPEQGKPEKHAVDAILCTGEYEGNCPGPHQLFLGCPGVSDEAKVARFCIGKGGTSTPLKVGISGNGCGYGLYKITCNE